MNKKIKLLNEIVNFPCEIQAYYDHDFHKHFIKSAYDLYNFVLNKKLVLSNTSFLDRKSIKLSFCNCFHIWETKNNVNISY